MSPAVHPEFVGELSPVTDAGWGGPSDVHVGATGTRGEVVAGVNDAVWVGLLGPVGGEVQVAASAVAMVTPLLQSAFHKVESAEDTVFDTLWAGANTADELLRKRYSPVDPAGRAGLVLACIQHRAAFMVWTESGAAYLLRDAEVVNAVEGGRVLVDTTGGVDELSPTGLLEEEHDPPHAFLGGRPVDSSELVLHEVDPPWMLRHGDRLVLAPCALSDDLSLAELVSLLGSGPVEGAAHTLQTVLRMRSGVEAPVVVIEVGGLEEAELQADDDTFEHLLEGLEDLLPAAFAEQLVELERGLPSLEPGDDATDPFAPVRGIDAFSSEASADLDDAQSSDLHYTPPDGTRLQERDYDALPVGDTLVPSRSERIAEDDASDAAALSEADLPTEAAPIAVKAAAPAVSPSVPAASSAPASSAGRWLGALLLLFGAAALALLAGLGGVL